MGFQAIFTGGSGTRISAELQVYNVPVPEGWAQDKAHLTFPSAHMGPTPEQEAGAQGRGQSWGRAWQVSQPKLETTVQNSILKK